MAAIQDYNNRAAWFKQQQHDTPVVLRHLTLHSCAHLSSEACGCRSAGTKQDVCCCCWSTQTNQLSGLNEC